MNFSIMNRKTGQIVYDGIFENTFTMLQDFGQAMGRVPATPDKAREIMGLHGAV